MAKRRLRPVVAITAILFCFFFYSTHKASTAWHGLPQHFDLVFMNGPDAADDELVAGSDPFKEPEFVNWNPKPIFTPGSPMPSGHNYSTTLVIAKTTEEDTTWLLDQIPEDIKLSTWVADDPTAPLHPPKNKGHEVMIYLSWIIDNYDNLPDVTIFLHAHHHAWHNDDVLSHDASIMVTRLNHARVWREGYINMRCTWQHGCPAWIHPGETQSNPNKPEQAYLAESWSELFPLDPVPQVLAQPCSSQFALSRERILAKPHAQYIWYREWLFSTKIPDHISGRVWEYLWQFVFTGNNIYCPSEASCFCDQYGSCFGGEERYAEFKELKKELEDREDDLRQWELKKAFDDKKKAAEEVKKKEPEEDVKKKEPEEGKLQREETKKPEEGKNEEYKREIARLKSAVEKLMKEAVERGNDPKKRAEELGRKWKEGDGF